MKLKFNEGELIEIKWKDAAGADGWVNLPDVVACELATIHSVGYVMRSTKSLLTITNSMDITNDNCGAFLVIPTACIVEANVLK